MLSLRARPSPAVRISDEERDLDVSALLTTPEPEKWEPFRTFRHVPNVNLDAPNVRYIDINGDGLSDILVHEQDRVTWYPSLGADGFDAPIVVGQPGNDEAASPQLVWQDAQRAVFYADMTGDGLSDIVRVQNGRIVYWPNLGYGRFGRMIQMTGVPVFDRPDRFEASRVRLADIDGSGANDLVYLGGDGVKMWFNQAGNGFGGETELTQIPRVDTMATVEVVDLLGNGTACLVWSTALPGREGSQIAYVDLMAQGKPYLLQSVSNNLGMTTTVTYAPSTKFYLADRAAGKPWITKLPFPVQVVEQVEVFEAITERRFVSRYRYHHGYFDGPEREFRGFGLVEQEDTESFADYSGLELPTSGHRTCQKICG